jgi:hypothetical protein
MPEVEDRYDAFEAVLRIDHGEHLDVLLVDQLQRLRAGGVGVHRHEVAGHHFVEAGGHVSDEGREAHAEVIEHRIDTGVRVAAAGGLIAFPAGARLEVGVGDGRADRVGVGIAVTEDSYGIGHGVR